MDKATRFADFEAMSFLTPLYLLGALAVTLPVVFHMIRRRPRGRQLFSSVMFLEPSPPRITRRSRIEHWLLLLLRSAVICLLALAFARPFWRVLQGQTTPGGARDLVLLLDTSASMRREGLWDEALTRADNLLDDLGPQDRLAVISFDSGTSLLFGFDQWTALDPAQRIEHVRSLLRAITPTWAATNLGGALIDAAERLEAASSHKDSSTARTIVLISDLQQGSDLQSLQAYHWPPDVGVELQTIGTSVSPNNAGLHPIIRSRQSKDDTETKVRVRLANAADGHLDQFRVTWGDASSNDEEQRREVSGSEISMIVPPGQTQTVSVPAREQRTTQLKLTGDDHDFDNTCYLPTATVKAARVQVLSDLPADDPEGPWYYLERALTSTTARPVVIQGFAPEHIVDSGPADLVVITSVASDEQLEQLRTFLAGGGMVLLVATNVETAHLIYQLAGVPSGAPTEATVEDYSMLTGIDWGHPLFTMFDQPRFADFTKVRFWKHRMIDSALVPGLRILARFDDGAVAFGEISVGSGRLVLLTSGWHPTDSQLALSTKFVPMMHGLLDSATGAGHRRVQFVVGDSVDLTQWELSNRRPIRVVTPDGSAIPVTDLDVRFLQTTRPGIYRVVFEQTDEDDPLSFAVNLDPRESDTSRLSGEALTAAHVRIVKPTDSRELREERARQLRGSQLEQQQKLWRWLIIAAIGLLLVETCLSARASRMSAASSAQAG